MARSASSLALAFAALAGTAWAQTPVEGEVRRFLVEESVSQAMAEACAARGIVPAEDIRLRADALVARLTAEGHAAEEVIAALQSQPFAIAEDGAVLDYIQRNGIRRGDADAFCLWAETEIARGSALGQRLAYE